MTGHIPPSQQMDVLLYGGAPLLVLWFSAKLFWDIWRIRQHQRLVEGANARVPKGKGCFCVPQYAATFRYGRWLKLHLEESRVGNRYYEDGVEVPEYHAWRWSPLQKDKPI